MARVRRARGVIWVVWATLFALLLAIPGYADHDGEPGGGGNGGGNGNGGKRKGDPPTAIALDSHGRTYVGFASGGDLVRITHKGKKLKPFAVPIDGPVNGIAIGRYDRVWVDNGRIAVLLRRDGSEVGSLIHGPETCRKPGAPDRYGGIDAFGRMVFIANRCERSVEIFRRTGKRLAVLKPKGPGYPRGVAYLHGPGKRHARLYVTMPDRGVVLVYDVEKMRNGEKPVRTVKVPRPPGGKRPEPSGVTVNRFAQVVVADRVNNGLYFLDGSHSFRRYRTLGHPPRRGRGWGRLDRPVGLAQHRQDRTRLSGTIVVAEGGNRRVQRWNTYGYTYWVTGVKAPKG